MNSSQQVTKIAKALLEAQKDMGDVTKSSKNPFFKSTFADLNSIRAVVTPALNAQGISILQPTIALGDKNYVETILLHESGEFISGITEIKNADGKPQSEGSGISYARRYGLQSMLNVGAVDDDGELAQGRKQDAKVDNKVSSQVSAGSLQSNTDKQLPDVLRAESVVTLPNTNKVSSPIKETATKDLVKKAFALLEAQGRISAEAFKMNYFGNKGISAVAPSEFPNIYAKLKKDFPTLNTNGKGA